MEILGTIAPISQLLSTSKALVELYDDFKTAPIELQRLRSRIDIVQFQLNNAERLCNVVCDDAEILSGDFLSTFGRTLSEVQQAVDDV